MSKPAAERPLWVHQDRLDLSFPAVQGTALLLKARFLLAGMAGRVKFFSQQRIFFCLYDAIFLSRPVTGRKQPGYFMAFFLQKKKCNRAEGPPTAEQDTLQRGMRANGASRAMRGNDLSYKKGEAGIRNRKPGRRGLPQRRRAATGRSE